MLVSQLLANLTARGAELSANGDKLRVRGDELITDDDRAAIRANKPALIAIIRMRDYEAWTRANKVDSRHAAHLKHLHAYAEYLGGEYLTLNGEPLPMRYTHFDAGQAYRDGQKAPAADYLALNVPTAKDIEFSLAITTAHPQARPAG